MNKIIRMRGEVPQFKRCCMCLPLRHGLIVWGYVRLVIGVILLVEFTRSFFRMIAISKNEEGYEIYVVMFGFFVIVGGADIVLHVVFVYAEHTKDVKMLKAYYIYSFILWILLIILGIWLSAAAVHAILHQEMGFIHVVVVLLQVATFLSEIVIQVYILLLVRSELIKLSSDYEFRFVNNAAESDCEMKFEEDNIVKGDITANTHIIAHTDTEVDGDIASNRNVANGVKGVYTNVTGELINTVAY